MKGYKQILFKIPNHIYMSIMNDKVETGQTIGQIINTILEKHYGRTAKPNNK